MGDYNGGTISYGYGPTSSDVDSVLSERVSKPNSNNKRFETSQRAPPNDAYSRYMSRFETGPAAEQATAQLSGGILKNGNGSSSWSQSQSQVRSQDRGSSRGELTSTSESSGNSKSASKLFSRVKSSFSRQEDDQDLVSRILRDNQRLAAPRQRRRRRRRASRASQNDSSEMVSRDFYRRGSSRRSSNSESYNDDLAGDQYYYEDDDDDDDDEYDYYDEYEYEDEYPETHSESRQSYVTNKGSGFSSNQKVGGFFGMLASKVKQSWRDRGLNSSYDSYPLDRNRAGLARRGPPLWDGSQQYGMQPRWDFGLSGQNVWNWSLNPNYLQSYPHSRHYFTTPSMYNEGSPWNWYWQPFGITWLRYAIILYDELGGLIFYAISSVPFLWSLTEPVNWLAMNGFRIACTALLIIQAGGIFYAIYMVITLFIFFCKVAFMLLSPFIMLIDALVGRDSRR